MLRCDNSLVLKTKTGKACQRTEKWRKLTAAGPYGGGLFNSLTLSRDNESNVQRYNVATLQRDQPSTDIVATLQHDQPPTYNLHRLTDSSRTYATDLGSLVASFMEGPAGIVTVVVYCDGISSVLRR